MPPKKADASKRGDVSMAQFVYDGDMDQTEPAPAVPPQLKPAVAAAAASASTTTHMMDMDDPADSSLLADKDRDKEKDKKDKEKEREKDAVTIEDLILPKSIITRLAKGVLPSNTQIQANAILAMSKSATVFINHLANAANEHTLSANKKTIMPADVFKALEDVEFPFFRERVEAEFKKFNDTQTTKRNTYRRKVAAQKKGEKPDPDGLDPNASLLSMTSTTTQPESAPRSAKKQKPNAAHEDSAMDIDDDETQEPRDASDADTEPEGEHGEEDEEDDQDNGEEEDEEEDENEEDNEDDVRDRLEQRRKPDDDDDDALDDDGDSD